MTSDAALVYPVDYVNALHQQIVAFQHSFDQLNAELHDLRERDRVLSQQLERRAGGRDAFTQALLAEKDAALDDLKAAQSVILEQARQLAQYRTMREEDDQTVRQAIERAERAEAEMVVLQAKYEDADAAAMSLVDMYDMTREQKHRVLARLYEVYRQLVRVKRCPERPSCVTCDYHLDAAIDAIGWVPPDERQETPHGD